MVHLQKTLAVAILMVSCHEDCFFSMGRVICPHQLGRCGDTLRSICEKWTSRFWASQFRDLRDQTCSRMFYAALYIGLSHTAVDFYLYDAQMRPEPNCFDRETSRAVW